MTYVCLLTVQEASAPDESTLYAKMLFLSVRESPSGASLPPYYVPLVKLEV